MTGNESWKDEYDPKLFSRCPLCGGCLYGSYEDHRWNCPRSAGAIEIDIDKERT